MMDGKCPVKHDTSPASQCPADDNARSPWDRFFSRGQASPSYKHPQPISGLSTERETSSIPKSAGENWVYPSEAQFFAAMARKNHHPQATDMRTIVPIHNAVNERAWAEVMKWEAGKGGEACGGVTLVNFKGRPGEMSPKARWKTLLGYVHVRNLMSNPLLINDIDQIYTTIRPSRLGRRQVRDTLALYYRFLHWSEPWSRF
jgi:cytochrome c heme-lyase